MTQGDALAVAVGAAMALILVSRAVRASRLSFKTKIGMAVVWAMLIVGTAAMAAWWHPE